MPRKVVVSFEKDTIKVVYATPRKGNLLVQKVLSLKDDEFDEFLTKEKTKGFIVVASFKAYYSDLFYIPPVKKERYIKGVLEPEIRKKFPQLKDFSFIYTTFGDVPYEGKTKREVFALAINREEIEVLTNRFERHNKQIIHLIPDVSSLSQIVQPEGEPVLCISRLEKDCYLFLLKDEMPYFIRVIQGVDGGIYNTDVETINMTINYCRQVLKTPPSCVLLIGNEDLKYIAEAGISSPLTCLNYPSQILAPKETVEEYKTPLGCLLGSIKRQGFLRENDCLPTDYKALYATTTFLSYLTGFFLLLSLIGLLLISNQIFTMAEIKERIEGIRGEIKGLEQVGSKYLVKKDEFSRFAPFVNIMKGIDSTPDIQEVLLLLSGIYREDISIDNISIMAEGGTIKLSIKGVVSTQDLVDMQINYQSLINSMKVIGGVEVLSHALTIEDKTFIIEGRYLSNA